MIKKIVLSNAWVALLVSGMVLCSSGCQQAPPKEKINLTLQELKQYDGKDGRPTYVAVEGDIYDISRCGYWKNGAHGKSKGKAFAGEDLTEVLANSRHGLKYLKRYPLVGRIVEK